MSKKGLNRKASVKLTSEGFSIHTFEVSLQYTELSWKHIKDRLYKELAKRDTGEQAWIYATNKKRNRYVCTRYSGHGVRITLEHNSSSSEIESYYVRMVINPRKLLDPNASYLGILKPAGDVAEKISKAFCKLFHDTPFEEDLNQYYLTRVDVCTNVECDNAKIFRELIRATQKQPAPPKLERQFYTCPDRKKEVRYNKHYIHYTCKSYELVMYDKTYQLTEEGLNLSYEKLPEGVLRYELRLKRNYIRTLEKRYKTKNTTEFLQTVVDEALRLLFTKFYENFPPDYYWRLGELLKKIWDIPCAEHIRYKMIAVSKLTSECSGVDEAFEKLGYSKEVKKTLLQQFRLMELSPVPLRKNFSAEWIPAPTYLLYLLADNKDAVVYIPYVRIK